ncbi:ATP-binding cassette domain-containing protein [Sphingorhabdus sp.]|jgi:microcin C transport system ATP-binding protein|uniref:ATP-binding cassette domain-containing protein n=2 Tax=Sphingorhabdus sp. TaxID=1902408 RepID=UPI003BB06F2B|nr:ABC transporter ATP-binding protein [Sphingomonadales bacterium]MBK9431281.1 ABC transporter ATP-binding protein [Sphingomonadales bacterium]
MSDGYLLQNLSIRIGERQIVDDISFSLAPGEIVALAGASGAGKSMSAMTPFGLSAGKASGSAMFDGTELVGLSESELSKVRAEKVGFVFQQPLTALTPHRTVRQHLSEAAMQAGGASPDKAAMVAMLEAVGLTRPDERLAQYPHRLSGGERQRVLIAAALAHGPRYLVADEPVSALDAALRGEIMALLVRLCRERDMAMLLVSHDLAGIEHHADRLLLLDQGRVIESGSARQIATAPATDYGKRLMAATPRLSEPLAELPVTGEIILETEKVTVTFPKPGWQRGRIGAVVDADLSLARGETLALVGGSGSGKSTLGRAIAGLGPMASGTIRWQGDALPQREHRSTEHRRLIQPVFQDPVASLDPRWSVTDIILEPVKFLATIASPPEANGYVEKLLQEVGLPPDFAIRKPASLSGGQAQRVAIARALSANPDMLLLDEATSALDPLVADGVVELFGRLQRERGLSLLFITHDLALARRAAHRIAVMEAGRIVECASREELFTSPRAEATKRLIAASG